MKKRIRGLLVFLCAFLLVVPAGAAGANLNGRWVSLQYGTLSFSQAGESFTAVWSGANAAGAMPGRQGKNKTAGAAFPPDLVLWYYFPNRAGLGGACHCHYSGPGNITLMP